MTRRVTSHVNGRAAQWRGASITPARPRRALAMLYALCLCLEQKKKNTDAVELEA